MGASNRRVEALVGQDAFREFAAERALVSQLTSALKTPREQLTERVADLAAQLKAAEKRIAQFEAAERAGRVPAIAQSATSLGSVQFVAHDLGAVGGADEVREIATGVRDTFGSAPAVTAVSGIANGRPMVVIAANDAARALGAKAGALAKIAAGVLGGGGGGRDDVAQGGGSDVSALPAAFAAIEQELRRA